MKIYTNYSDYMVELNNKIDNTNDAQLRSVMIDLMLDVQKCKKNGTLVENFNFDE